MSARNKAYLYILIANIIWGVAGPVIKYTLGYFDTITFLTFRFGLTSAILMPLWLVSERHKHHLFPPLSGADWTILITMGLTATTIQLGLLFFGFERTTAIEGTLIASIAPVFVALAGHHFLNEKVTKREQIGMLTALIGSLLVVGVPNTISGMWGNFLVLLGNGAWVTEVILTKKLLRHDLSPLFLTMFSFFVGFLSMTPIYFLTGNHHMPAYGQPWLGFSYMVLISGIVAYWLFLKGQKTIETSEANTFLYLQPIITTPLAYFWLHEQISWNFMIGGVVIALGVLIASLKPHHPSPLP